MYLLISATCCSNRKNFKITSADEEQSKRKNQAVDIHYILDTVFHISYLSGNTQNSHSDKIKIDKLKRRIYGMTSYFDIPMTQLMPTLVLKPETKMFLDTPNRFKDIHEELVEMSESQFVRYKRAREKEIETNKKNKKRKTDDEEDAEEEYSSYKTQSRSKCNFVFNHYAETTETKHQKARAFREMMENRKDMENVQSSEENEEDVTSDVENEDEATPDSQSGGVGDEEAQLDLEEDQQPEEEGDVKLNKQINQLMKLYGGMVPYFGLDAMKESAPKMAEIIAKIQNKTDYKGNHLVYSTFRTFEGVNFMAKGLQETDRYPFEIEHTKNKRSYVISEKTMEHLRKKKTTYLDFGNKENDEKKKTALRYLFNSDWEEPILQNAQLQQQLTEICSLNQDEGKIVRNSLGCMIDTFLITDSGTRGISLKCIRWEHILEPFWHMIKLLQVKGRGSRICSQMRLPENERTLKVFIYISTFTDEQKKQLGYDFDTVVVNGIDEKITTDQYLYRASLKKDIINEDFIECLRSTAFDCTLFNKEKFRNKENRPYTCFGYHQDTPLEFTTKPDIKKDTVLIV